MLKELYKYHRLFVFDSLSKKIFDKIMKVFMSYEYKYRNMLYVSWCMIRLIVVRRKDISIINKLDNFFLVWKIKPCCSILVYKSINTYLIRTPCAWFFEDAIDFSWIRSLFEIRSRILTTTKKTAQNRHVSVFIA